MKRKTKSLKKTATTMPARIFAQASPRSIGGVSMFDALGGINADTVANFQSEPRTIDEAVNRLRGAGFDILQVTAYTINIAGSQATYEKAFRTKLVIEQREVIKPGAVKGLAEFIECPDTARPGLIATVGTPFEDALEGVAIEEPRFLMASMFPPPVPYWHLDMPADVSLGLNADRTHRSGLTGSGIRVAMVDTGHFAHPFFAERGYRVAAVTLGPGAANSLRDESGHGTGESANIFAVAPDVELLPVKFLLTNTTGAFNDAVALNPHIITCSWGSSRRDPKLPQPTGSPLSAADLALATAVAAAWAAGIVVIFSAGNGQWGFPAQHPDCIAAGGVFMANDGSFNASDYASGFISNYYPGRRVPDVCGLVGMRPRAIYIMLPVEPGDDIDSIPWNDLSGRGLQGGTFPQGDETGANDGWACFSGTSAAAPQLAGLAALIRQACPRLTPADVRDIMRKTARDVTTGSCSPNTGGHAATVGPDTATGDGLVDVHKAVLLAKIRCLGPIGPRRLPGAGPRRGVEPRQPRTIEPRTIEPRRPPQPGVKPPQPGVILRQPQPEPGPIQPISPAGLSGPCLEAVSLQDQAGAEGQGVPLSRGDIQALEDMVIKSEIKFE